MRSLVLLVTLMALPGTAFAGSFAKAGDIGIDAGSIQTIGAPAPKPAAAPVDPSLGPGHELIRIAEVDGKQRIFRTEAWLGGSPVTYVTAATSADIAALKQRGIDVASTKEQMMLPGVAVASSDTKTDMAGIDRADTTGSLDPVKLKPLDTAGLKLRTNLGS